MTARTTASAPSRVVIDGVPRIGYDVRLCPFPGSVESIMGFLKEPVDYDYVMGVTGACFRRTYHKDDGGNVDLMYFSPEPQRRVFDALGYEFRTVPWDDKDEMVAAIRGSIAAGRPVIACGIVGPPEAGIVAGYDRGGDTLIGLSYFQDRGRFPGYYEQPGWYERVAQRPPAPDGGLGPVAERVGLIVLGERRAKPSAREVLVSSIAWAIDLERTARRANLPDHVCGLAAYDAWADGLEVDADFPADDPDALATRGMIYGDQSVMLCERENAARFLRQMAGVAPEAAQELNAAADGFDRVGKVQGLWPWPSHDPQGPEVRRGLADPALRRTLAKKIRECRDHETEAVGHLEKALAILSPLPEKADLDTPTPEQLTRGKRWQIENVPGPIAFRAACNVMGDDLGKELTDWSIDHAYDLCCAASGEAFDFLLSIRKSGGTPGEHFRRPSADEQREAMQRMLQAIGRDGEVLALAGGGKKDAEFGEAVMRARVMDCLARAKRPVLLSGCPEPGYAAVITGYSHDGKVLHGWSVTGGGPSILFEPEKKQEFADWFAKAQAVAVFKDKTAPAGPRVQKRMLAQAAEFLDRKDIGDYLAGPALYEAWAKAFTDGTGPAEQTAAVKHYNAFIDPAIWDLAERRHYARVTCDRLADAYPAAAGDLRAASAEFGAIHDLMWQINGTGGAKGPGEVLPNVHDAAVRRQIAALIREAAAHDAKAAEHLRSAAAKVQQTARPFLPAPASD